METIWEGKAKGRKNETTDINAPLVYIEATFWTNNYDLPQTSIKTKHAYGNIKTENLLEKREAKIRYGTSDFALQDLELGGVEPPRNSLCASFLYFPSLSSHKFNGKTSEK